MEKEKFDFDNAYESVYIFSKEHNAYLFYGSYLGLNILKSDTEAEKIEKCEIADGELV